MVLLLRMAVYLFCKLEFGCVGLLSQKIRGYLLEKIGVSSKMNSDIKENY